MSDVKEKLGGSEVQHGPFSDRVFLMKLAREDFPGHPFSTRRTG